MHRLGFLPSSSSSLSLFAYHPIVPIFILIPILIAGHPSLASISCCATCSVLHYPHLGSVPAHVDLSCPPHRTVCIRILPSQLLVFISFSHLSLFLDVFCPLSCTIISVCLCLRLSSLCILLSLSLSLSHCFHWGLSRCHRRPLLYAYAYAYLPRSTSNPPHFQNSNFSRLQTEYRPEPAEPEPEPKHTSDRTQRSSATSRTAHRAPPPRADPGRS